MKRIFWLALLPLLLLVAADVLPAQQRDEEACVVTVEGENRNRTVAGTIDQECGVGGIVFRQFTHSAPWGNWGVSSNYSTQIKDEDQFRGWKWKDGPRTKLQWNSCTTGFPPPDRRYYSPPDYRSQRSDAPVPHGTRSFRTNVVSCQQAYTEGEPLSGCSSLTGTRVIEPENHMTLYELDKPDGNDLVETLYFPGTSVTFRNCTRHDCPEQTTRWVGVTRDTSAAAQVDAQLRMKASANLMGYCGEPEDWDSN